MLSRKVVLFVLLVLATAPALVQAQTSSSALVQGTVYDPTKAVIPGASVELLSTATNLKFTQGTNAAGQYLFSDVAPGTYKITVTAQGFRTSVIPAFKVSVAKSYTFDITLEVGTKAEVVEVRAGTAVEMQSTDATVGTVVGGEELLRLPTPDRQISSLLILQPLVQPITRGVATCSGGQVAGARSDQTVFLLDGGDATSDTEGSGGYNTGFDGAIRPMIPTPAESIEEFRVGTTNPNSTFGRSQGGQVAMITKRGTNDIHGSAYWYHQNDNLNANAWDNNRSGVPKQELKDNRGGFTLGGPIWKDKTWLFGHLEERRFPRRATFTRLVPTDSLRAGILTFRDLAGNPIQYNLNPANGALSTACNNTGSFGGLMFTPGACDPRQIGMSPVVKAIWQTEEPEGNNTSAGDGLNTIGFTSTVDDTQKDDFFVVRLDQKLNDKWNFFGSYRYSRHAEPGTQQLDISTTGISGCKAPCSTRVNPLQPRYLVYGVNGQISSTLTSETRVSWFRHWWSWATRAPFPQVAGTAAAVQINGESTNSLQPMNIDTQKARSRIWNGKDWFVSENLTWLKGKHAFQFGGGYRHQGIFHERTDKVTGGLTTAPIFWLQAGSFAKVKGAQRPVICDETVGITTNCLKSGNIGGWNGLYNSVLGIVDKTAQIQTRDGDLNPFPLGTPLEAHVLIQDVESYFQDVWRIKPSLTLTLGLTYDVQLPPTEALGKQMVPVYAATHTPIKMDDYFAQRATAANNGTIFNPDIAFSPIRHVPGMSRVTDIKWNNVGPRLAAAWRPTFNNFFFGNGKTVIRAGWSVTYTRMNGVGLVMTPLLGIGLAEARQCSGPLSNGTCSGAKTNPATAFRVGTDGDGSSILPSTIPVTPAQIPFPPAGILRDRAFMIDPGFRLGYSHGFDLTWQRELPGDMLLEVGYVGRLGRNLVQNADMPATPFFMDDRPCVGLGTCASASGQTLAQAFEAVAAQIRAGVTPFNPDGTPNAAFQTQPWFENMDPFSGTRVLADTFSDSSFVGDLASVMLFGVDLDLFGNGLTPVDNIQTFLNNWTYWHGESDYHAGFISVRKRMSHGLTYDANYTFSHSIDVFGINQENTGFSYTSPFRRDIDRQPSQFDRRHVFNFHWYYELPFGRGKHFSTSSGFLDKFIGGWHFSGILTASSGLPQCVGADGNYGTLTGFTCAIPTAKISGSGLHHGVAGSNGIGTAGDPAAGGSGLNMFSDPSAVFNKFRFPMMTQDFRTGGGQFRGLRHWNVDLSVGKRTSIRERLAVVFTADFLNAFNHPNFADPCLAFGACDLSSPDTFGVIDSTLAAGSPLGAAFGARFIQLGIRIEF